MKEIKITLEDLFGEQKLIAEIIGIEAYLKLAEVYGGQSIYIAKMDKVENIQRNARIIADFNGYNHKFLANKYHLSERSIRAIIAEYVHSPLPGQLSFFDDS